MEYPIIDVSSWKQDPREYGAGERAKEWLIDPGTGKLAMFKIPREDRGEHWAEKLCSEFAKVLDFPCADVNIAVRNGVIGCLSYFFVDKENGYSHFDGGNYFPNDYDFEKNAGYNLQLIRTVMDQLDTSEQKLFQEFLYIIVFDALVANGDRHQDNWGITRHETREEAFISPLYDNSATLGRDLNEQRLNELLDSRTEMIRYISRSKSKIGWDNVRCQKHFILVKELTREYPEEMHGLLERLKLLNDSIVEEVLNKMPKTIMTDIQKQFVIQFVKERRDILIRIGEKMNVETSKLLLIWKDPNTRNRFTVGKLSFEENTYIFKYKDPDLSDAVAHGFKYYPNFTDHTQTYTSEGTLFQPFLKRLPRSARPDYPLLLERYGLNPTSSEMEILEATRGRLPTDTFEFVRDIQFVENEPLQISFDIAGARHYITESELKQKINVGAQVILEPNPANEYDIYAVKVLLADKNIHIGHVPKYYSKVISEILAKVKDYKAIIVYTDFDNISPDEWVKISVQT
ncbi:HIRAN domain-containing protein [Brevibacillus centrosporus]|uniref:HIRAN domain-containing protein n=1 Tax=Brevibacillus centrosporus TaxID=54910 RepID=UPI000F0A0889|nr:HIRAN domain-containing protein [Brevibacillus centrosporus]MEC2130518.1 HIRAN domain-containing protein [Brevibacillus centrosporus]RNB68879.1 hypothetical protein EDM55_15830 [Brevibacillus centrosporus]GED34867.1 hypothetical protein BCE02nite_60080 [Brevibacillus centrosporus]